MSKRKSVSSILIYSICLKAALFAGCSTSLRKGGESPAPELTHETVSTITRDINFVYFIYSNGNIESGILLKWDSDSILIQERDKTGLSHIPSEGLISIRAVTGNRTWESMAIGAVLIGGYVLIADFGNLSRDSFGMAVLKLFVSPIIVVGSIAVGSGMERTTEYRVPEGFIFPPDNLLSQNKIEESPKSDRKKR